MGNCCSTNSDSKQPLKRNEKNISNSNAQKKEDKIELAFKAKRANIFTEGVDFSREAFSQKKFPKTERQKHLISMIHNHTHSKLIIHAHYIFIVCTIISI